MAQVTHQEFKSTQWTGEQAAAITSDHDVLLTANAGTGKTTTVVGKILWLIGLDVGLPMCPNPCRLDEIAAITFTEKAAHDLKSKLREEIETSPRSDELLWQIDRAALGTIHGFCGQILREYALRLGIDPTFQVIDERASLFEQNAVIKQVLMDAIAANDEGAIELIGDFTLTGYEFSSGAVDLVRDVMRDMRWHRGRYDNWCTNGELNIAYLEQIFGATLDPLDVDSVSRCRALSRLAHTALDRWEQRMRDENIRDYDAIIFDTHKLLAGPHGTAARDGLRRRYRILIIDEFQDTDAAQRDIAYAIGHGVDRPQLFLVGDPKQSIYGFRGADISVWNQVAADFGAARTLTLSQNFRSEPAVIAFVNDALDNAMQQTGAPLEAECPGTSVAYSHLAPSRAPKAGEVEWLQNTNEKRHNDWLGARIEQIVGKIDVVDVQTGQTRPCRYSDIAVLYRARTGGAEYQADLRRRNIPFYEQGQAGLMARQEVLDIINALRVVHNPADDLRAFAFLRSPFVGLRDEILARIQLDPAVRAGTLLDRAAKFAAEGEWFAAPEHELVCDVERAALQRGLELLESLRSLADRLPIDSLVEHIVAESGYRAHLHLMDGAREAIANIQAVIRVAEEFRDRPLGTFLQLWIQWDDEDQGLPQAPLYSSRDDVVTLSTIHAAKGLEWPVVFLVNVGAHATDKYARQYWSDVAFGPLLCPKKDDRGPRALRLLQRRMLEEAAEEVRLLYVATTRARDRLILVGGEKPVSFGSWLAHAAPLVTNGVVCDAPPAAAPSEPRMVPLSWLDAVTDADEIVSVRPLPLPQPRWITSATEQMQRARNPEVWELLYVHGVQPVWMFTPRARSADAADAADAVSNRSAHDAAPISAALHGTIVHGVLERIQEEQELAEILEETISDLDAPELENAVAEGSAYRAALEAEILQVVQSDEWKWYVEGEHYRELPFIHLAGPRDWRIGAFDLFKPGDDVNWIIDFKTHDITAAEAQRESKPYALQAKIYREAAAAYGEVRVKLHFTRPNVVVEMEE